MKIFSDSLNTAVFTTKFVMNDHSPIVYVIHGDEGDWQFFGDEDSIASEDAMIVALGQIIKSDSTIYEIADLPLGYYAVRKNTNTPWQVFKGDE